MATGKVLDRAAIDVYIPRMDISTLQLFIDVMRQGSFAAVARERAIDPSSVSRSIAGLEDELGIRLFQRSTRQLAPTEAGLVYFRRIEALVEDMQEAGATAADVSAQPRGILRVTATVAFGLTAILPILPRLVAAYPDLSVDLSLNDAMVDLLAERIDLAVRLGPLADSTLVAQPLMRTRHVVCASPDYLARRGRPHTPAELAQHDCLLFPMSGFRSRWLFRDAGGAVSEAAVGGRIIISNGIALQQCALAGMGPTLLSHWLVGDDLRAGRLVDLFPEYEVTATDFDTAAWLVYPSRSYVPLKVRVFIAALREGMQLAVPPE